MKKEQNIIEGSVLHVLNFIIMGLMRHGFTLAMEDELSDLKGLVRTDQAHWMSSEGKGIAYTNVEVELLGQVKDPAVKRLMQVARKVIGFHYVYLVVNDLDEDEVILDDDCRQIGADVFNAYVFCRKDDGLLEEKLESLREFYQQMDMMLFHCAMQFCLERIEILPEVACAYHDHWYRKRYEKLYMDQNAGLLLCLMSELENQSGSLPD